MLPKTRARSKKMTQETQPFVSHKAKAMYIDNYLEALLEAKDQQDAEAEKYPEAEMNLSN